MGWKNRTIASYDHHAQSAVLLWRGAFVFVIAGPWWHGHFLDETERVTDGFRAGEDPFPPAQSPRIQACGGGERQFREQSYDAESAAAQ